MVEPQQGVGLIEAKGARGATVVVAGKATVVTVLVVTVLVATVAVGLVEMGATRAGAGNLMDQRTVPNRGAERTPNLTLIRSTSLVTSTQSMRGPRM